MLFSDKNNGHHLLVRGSVLPQDASRADQGKCSLQGAVPLWDRLADRGRGRGSLLLLPSPLSLPCLLAPHTHLSLRRDGCFSVFRLNLLLHAAAPVFTPASARHARVCVSVCVPHANTRRPAAPPPGAPACALARPHVHTDNVAALGVSSCRNHLSLELTTNKSLASGEAVLRAAWPLQSLIINSVSFSKRVGVRHSPTRRHRRIL